MAGRSSFLILSHQMMSMVEPLATALQDRGVETYVLASRPTRKLDTSWRSKVELLHVTDDYVLDRPDVDLLLKELSAAGIQPLGCLAVWDGYRELMAYANARIGAVDLSEATVRQLRDKLSMRTCLRERGLSATGAWPLDEQRYNALADRTRYFVKPREGLASVGAFRADQLEGVAELETIWRKVQQDAAYAGVFAGSPAFILEEFIDGTEYSFEVGIADGKPTVYAVHEKVDLQQSGKTMLENACVCPPRSICATEIERGIDYIELCLAALGADTGVYHIEARFQSGRGWEIVEVNPRVGGACIIASTQRHSGVDLLEHWIDLVLGQPAGPGSADRTDGAGKHSTFFRVFFGEPGRRISRVRRQPSRIEALEDKAFVHDGDTLPQTDRELFIGQALWDITAIGPGELDDFIAETKSHLTVEYLQ